MYDPNNPITPPPGGFSITSAPGGSFSAPGGRPGAPPVTGQPLPPTQAPRTPNPNKGSGNFLQGGGITPGGMPPIPGTENLAGVGAGMGRGAWEMGDMSRDQRTAARDARQAYLEQFKNSIFQWLASRPNDPAQMQTWMSQRPEFSRDSMLAAMFAPTAPATGTAPAPTPPPPTL